MSTEAPSTSHFDMVDEVVAFALTKHDAGLFHGGRRKKLWEHNELQMRIDECDDWYSWNIDDQKLFKHTGAKLTSDNLCDKAIELKWLLHGLFKRADCNRKRRLVKYYVRVWGGIRRNSEETIRKYACHSPEELISRGVAGIASWSKALALHDPSTYAIYDARVAVSLNYIVARKGDRGRDERRGFPVPPSQNAYISNARRVCETLSRRFGIACHDKSSFYPEYCRCIAKSANILSERLNRRICMHRVEMMLFALAEQSAHGLFAFERSSSAF